MAVMPTGAIYKTLTFDGQTSSSYHVYITGEAVFNAPERNVEMISIPGRNGAFALDHGRFENIEVTYPAGIVADSETDFAQAVSDFRNFLCSRTGYCRLTDDYNSNEYRMAVYKSGLEVTNAQLLAGEFSITFECKPQRFLTSGESAISVTSGDTITNPTLFDARPLLEVDGYGDIDINGDTITVAQSTPLGYIQVSEYKNWSGAAFSFTQTVAIDDTFAVTGDTIDWVNSGGVSNFAVYWTPTGGMSDITNVSTATTGDVSGGCSPSGNYYNSYILLGTNTSFAYGTSGTFAGTVTTTFTSTLYGTLTGTLTMSLAYDGTDTFTLTVSQTVPSYFTENKYNRIFTFEAAWLDSSYGGTIYIDLDAGEAYMKSNNTIGSYNNGVSIPAELPALVSGSNTITYDNTFTSVSITPRWWKV